MPTIKIENSGQYPARPTPSRLPSHDFAQILQQKNVAEPTPVVNAGKGQDIKPGLVELGTINQNNPTVSHLLRSNNTYHDDSWNIIFSEINKGKAFTSIKEGAQVLLDPSTNELLWNNRPLTPLPEPGIPAGIRPDAITDQGQIIVGKISKESPTVSHLLKHHEIYSKNAWNIVFSSVNKDKSYSSLQPGTVITIDPQTFELSFHRENSPALHTSKTISRAAIENLSTTAENFFENDKDFSTRLADSVKAYIGTPYKDINCYGLLVRGLRNQGISYTGKGGLRENLEQLAGEHGLPLNAYQNGEGLVETAGRMIYTKSFVTIDNSKGQAAEVFDEMRPVLKEGMILSFSTPSRGHTGVIAQKNNQWTYVNSGLIDNQIDSGMISRRVGEEILEPEIQNWFDLAEGRNESLKVSVGQLDEDKLRGHAGFIAQNQPAVPIM